MSGLAATGHDGTMRAMMGIMHSQKDTRSQGFTIVELLIVIVVIAILAAITVVSYNGITARASDAAIQSDLRNFGQKIEAQRAQTGSVPATSDLDALNFRSTQSAYGNHYVNSSGEWNLIYCRNDATFAVAATSKSGATYKYLSGQGVQAHSGSMLANTAMCNSLDVSNGSTGYAVRYVYHASVWDF